MGRWAQYYPPAIAAIGTAMYGIDTGIIATTIGHQSFNDHMFPPTGKNSTLTGKFVLCSPVPSRRWKACAIVSVYNAGQAVGTLFSGWTADRFSRKYTITIACATAILGILLSVIGSNIGMFIAGRLLTGWSSGMILPVVAIYMAEVSKPANRGVIVGFQGMGTAVGFCLANWLGYAGIFFEGDMQWRFPLAMQFPCAVFLLVGSVVLLPFTPRWLVSQDRVEEARVVLAKIHADEGEDFVDQEMIQIREQIAFERTLKQAGGEKWYSSFLLLFKRQYATRVGFVCFILSLTQLGGVGVIQNYQNIFYATVGFTGDTALLISGVYGFMGLGGQIFNLLFVAADKDYRYSLEDRWRRNTTLWVGCLVLAIMLAICEALSARFSDGSNQPAARATIAFIFLYSGLFAVFFNSTMWVVSSELLPIFIRGTGMALGTFSQGVASIVVSQVTPVALENISWKFYNVFIAANVVGVFVYLFLLPDTNGKTLEEIGELFGDTLATAHIGEIDVQKKDGTAVLELETVEKDTKV